MRTKKELEATLDKVLYDVNYVGGVQFWIRKHHDFMMATLKSLTEIAKVNNTKKPKKKGRK